jgi:peptide deformylase
MALFPIRQFGDPVLRMPVPPVTEFDQGLRKLVEDMTETMHAAPGVGLAAPQIGVARAVVVFNAQDDLGDRVLVNPELVESSGDYEYEEGCLSVAGYYWPITRPAFVRARGFDVRGQPVEFAGEGLLGRVLQHEIDHLRGILLIERLEKKIRKQALKSLREDVLGLEA